MEINMLFWSIFSPPTECLVRLMYYIPGIRLSEVPKTPEILTQAGEQLGKVTAIIKVITVMIKTLIAEIKT